MDIASSSFFEEGVTCNHSKTRHFSFLDLAVSIFLPMNMGDPSGGCMSLFDSSTTSILNQKEKFYKNVCTHKSERKSSGLRFILQNKLDNFASFFK